jgi:hypothetical protein
MTRTPVVPAPARLRSGDLAGLASVGLRTRKLRASLSALGIAIGVAAIVAVLGLAPSTLDPVNRARCITCPQAGRDARLNAPPTTMRRLP